MQYKQTPFEYIYSPKAFFAIQYSSLH